MAKLISLASSVIDRMENSGNIITLTFQQTAAIDNELATGLEKVKKEFEIKEKSSRAFVSKIELSSCSF